MAHPPCSTRLGPRRSGTCRTGSPPSSAGSTSAQRSWLERIQPLSGDGPPSKSPRSGCPAAQAGADTGPSVDRTQAPPFRAGQHRTVPLCKARAPPPPLSTSWTWQVTGQVLGCPVKAPGQPPDEGHQPAISSPSPSAMSLGRLPPWAAINQPQGRRQRVDGWLCCLRATPTRHVGPTGSPVCAGPAPQRPGLTALDVQGAGVIQPVQLVVAARLRLPGVGEAGARGLHQPTGRLEVVTFEAVVVPAEA